MDKLYYQILFVLGDIEVRRWAEELVGLVGADDGEGGVDPEEIQEAIQNPILFVEGARSKDYRDAFFRYLSIVERKGSAGGDAQAQRLMIRRQPFALRLNLLDDHAIAAMKTRLSGEAKGLKVDPPSDGELERFYIPNISKGAKFLRGHIASLRKAALSAGLKDYLEDLDEEIGQLETNSQDFPKADARRRIWEVEWMVAGALELLYAKDRDFLKQGNQIADALEISLGEIPRERLEVARALLGSVRSFLTYEIVDEKARDAVITAHVALSNLMFDKREAAEEAEGAGMPGFKEISMNAYRLIEVREFGRSIRETYRRASDAVMAGAALLDAAYRFRMRDSLTSFIRVVLPIINRARMTKVKVRDDASSEEAAASLDVRYDVVEMMPQIMEEGRPIHLEFGGGWARHGMEMARARPDDLVVSIDPDPEPLLKKYHYEAGLPKNFMPLLGRAEDIAPFTARAPFAEGAMMIAPPASSLNSMILSAILAVKPLGAINIYMDAAIENDLSWIYKSGFDVLDELIEAGDPSLPDSESLERYESVRHVRIMFCDLDPDGTDGSGWFVPGRDGGGSADGSDVVSMEAFSQGSTMAFDAASSTAVSNAAVSAAAAFSGLALAGVA